MFENPVNNFNPVDTFLKGYGLFPEIASRKQQLEQNQIQLDLERQKLVQQQAIMTIGQEAARTGDPRTIAMYSSINPEGAKGIRENIQSYVKEGLGHLQSIKEAKITDRPAVYKIKLTQLKQNNPYFDSSHYPDEYSPEVDKLIDADLTSGKDLDRQYSLQETDQGLKLFESKTGALTPTGIGNLNADKKRLELAKLNLENKKLNQEIENGGINPEQRFNNASKLRDDYTQASKSFVQTREAYDRIIESANNPSGAGDMSLIFSYMKMLDPGSTVREGEYATAEGTRGIPESIRAIYNKTLNGEKLTPKQRDDFTNRADKLYKRAEVAQEKTEKQYTNIARRNKLPVEDVVIDFKTTAQKQGSNNKVNIQEGVTATNPKTGEKIIFRGGKWQPI